MVENHIANIQLISEKYKKKQRKYYAELQNVNKDYSNRVRYAFVMCSLCIRDKCKKIPSPTIFGEGIMFFQY